MKKLYLVLYLACCGCSYVTPTEKAQQSDWESCLPGTVYLEVTAANISHFGVGGTAFCIATGLAISYDGPIAGLNFEGKNVYLFLTAGHVVRERQHSIVCGGRIVDVEEVFSIYVQTYDDNGLLLGKVKVSQADGDVFIVTSSSDIDVALICVATEKNLDIEPVKLVHEAVSDQVSVGDEISSVTCESYSFPSFRKGVVAAVFHDGVIVDMGVGPGASGGGIFIDGEVVALLVQSYSDTLGVAVKMNDIYMFLRNAGLRLDTMCEVEDG